MTSCASNIAHKYDASTSVAVNVFGGPTTFAGQCPSSFVEATDMGTAALLCGGIAAALLLDRSPRFSRLLLIVSVAFWAIRQYASIEIRANLLGPSSSWIEPLWDAARDQTIFEGIVFFLIPVIVIMSSRKLAKKMPISARKPERA